MVKYLHMKNSLIEQLAKDFDINRIYAQSIVDIVDFNNYPKSADIIIKSKPKPFVKWVGGKRQLLKQFRDLDLYPPKEFDTKKNKYFEPFVGGGAVFFDLLPEKAYLSDLNSDLVTTYNVIKEKVQDLIDSLSKHPHNKEYFLEIRSQDTQTLSDTEIASRFIYLNRTCFNGMYRVNSKGKFNVPFGKYTNPVICDKENLLRVSESLQKVSILNQDYKEVLKSAVAGDFIYFDPPYYPVNKTSSFTSYTSESFLEKQQIELRDTFIELHKKGCFVMLSNSDTDFINKIYSETEIDKIKIAKIQAGRMINSKSEKRGKVSEVLITNY